MDELREWLRKKVEEIEKKQSVEKIEVQEVKKESVSEEKTQEIPKVEKVENVFPQKEIMEEKVEVKRKSFSFSLFPQIFKNQKIRFYGLIGVIFVEVIVLVYLLYLLLA